MKKHMFMSFGVILILILIPAFAYAYGNPLGAYAVSTTIPGVQCRGASPVMLRTVKGPKGPYISKTRTINAGQWMIGTYSVIQDTTSCRNVPPGKNFDSKESTPFPVYSINAGFGLSR